MPQPHSFLPENEQQLPSGLFSTPFAGMYFLPFQSAADERGFYAELFRLPELNSELKESFGIQQVNLSYSLTHVIRGFHAENWRKLITILTGTAFCAFADFRQNSDTFGQVFTALVGESGIKGSFFLPAGIGNSFCVTQGPVNYVYAVDQLYKSRDTNGDVAVSLFDPDLQVPWPISREEMILSQRDRAAITFKERFSTNSAH
jgi:dTDP-4-dehydrorhamnose 3,5-epimerase